jgi:hypothetical protein
MGLWTGWPRAKDANIETEPGRTSGVFPTSAALEAEEGHEELGCMRWEEICECQKYRGRWVALRACRYDEHTGKATEGAVVDVDEDLVELCSRMRMSDRKNCAILFAEGE